MSTKVRKLLLMLALTFGIISVMLVVSNPSIAGSTQQLHAQHPHSLHFASSEYLPHYGPNLALQGAVVEIIRQAFANRAIEIEVSFLPFARAIYDTQQGHYHGIIAIWYTAEREQHFLYSEPIYNNEIVLLKRAGEFTHLVSPTDILHSEGTLGLVTGYAQNPVILNSSMQKVSVTTDEQIIRMLAMKRVDLVPTDKLNGLALFAQLPESLKNTKLSWLEQPIELKPMHLAFPKSRDDSAFLVNEFNLGLAALKESGDYERILTALLPDPVSMMRQETLSP